VVKLFFDTSVLVSALYPKHPAHSVCLPWLVRAVKGSDEGVVHLHTLAETFSVLSGMPVNPRISPASARAMLWTNLERFEIVALDASGYWDTLERMTQLHLNGGAVFDGLLAEAALKARADTLLTLNAKHFVRLGEDVAKIVQVPE